MYIKLYVEDMMLLYYSDNGMVQSQSSAATCTYETELHITFCNNVINLLSEQHLFFIMKL